MNYGETEKHRINPFPGFRVPGTIHRHSAARRAQATGLCAIGRLDAGMRPAEIGHGEVAHMINPDSAR